MTTKSIGDHAEERVVKYLQKLKYKIVDRNWRNRWCEIDIIAEKNGALFFIEVKYRHSILWGDGFDAIDRNKLVRMVRSAEIWVSQNQWQGEYELLVAKVDEDQIELRELF